MLPDYFDLSEKAGRLNLKVVSYGASWDVMASKMVKITWNVINNCSYGYGHNG